jgi:hypothetical protein
MQIVEGKPQYHNLHRLPTSASITAVALQVEVAQRHGLPPYISGYLPGNKNVSQPCTNTFIRTPHQETLPPSDFRPRAFALALNFKFSFQVSNTCTLLKFLAMTDPRSRHDHNSAQLRLCKSRRRQIRWISPHDHCRDQTARAFGAKRNRIELWYG